MDGACRARRVPARGRCRFTPVSASRPLAAPRARPSITRLPSFRPRVGISAPLLRRIPPLLVSSSSCFLLPVCFWHSLPFLPEIQMLLLHESFRQSDQWRRCSWFPLALLLQEKLHSGHFVSLLYKFFPSPHLLLRKERVLQAGEGKGERNIILKPVRSSDNQPNNKNPTQQNHISKDWTFLDSLRHSWHSLHLHTEQAFHSPHVALSTALGNHISAPHRPALLHLAKGPSPYPGAALPQLAGSPNAHLTRQGPDIFQILLSPGPCDGAQPRGGRVDYL